jgi:hypothetical protein
VLSAIVVRYRHDVRIVMRDQFADVALIAVVMIPLSARL